VLKGINEQCYSKLWLEVFALSSKITILAYSELLTRKTEHGRPPTDFKGANYLISAGKRELGNAVFKLTPCQNKLLACHLSAIGEKHLVLAPSVKCKHWKIEDTFLRIKA